MLKKRSQFALSSQKFVTAVCLCPNLFFTDNDLSSKICGLEYCKVDQES